MYVYMHRHMVWCYYSFIKTWPKKVWSYNCLFVWGFSSHSRIFHWYRDATITGEGLQILTYTWHSWQLSNEGYVPHLLWHGTSFYNGHLRGPVTLTPVAELLAVELSLPVLTKSRLVFERPTFGMRDERSITDCANTAAIWN